jgi:hypothetical protein
MYDSQLSSAGTQSEGRCQQTGNLIDELGQHWPDVIDVMFNSQWPEGCEQSIGCARALVLVGETVTKTCSRRV